MSLFRRKYQDWTLEELAKEKEKYERQVALYEKEKEILALKHSMHRWRMPTKTELIAAFLFVNFTAVEVYSMWVMIYLQDISALYALITAILAEPITFAVYVLKAYHGKKQEEAVKLERDKMALDHSSPFEDGMDEEADPENDG